MSLVRAALAPTASRCDNLLIGNGSPNKAWRAIGCVETINSDAATGEARLDGHAGTAT